MQDNTRRTLVLIVVAVTALVGLAAVVVTRSVVKPLCDLRRDLTKDDGTARATLDCADELGDLSEPRASG